jgi:23S rRNA (uridine2552-2'-O)-methyltransferase
MPQAKKKHRSNWEWIERHLSDPFVKRSVQEGYRSRAAYKLTEIDDKDRLLRPGAIVVDLGAAPGSWTQVIRERLSRHGKLSGRVLALDILPMEPILAEKKEPLADAVAGFGQVADWRNFILLPPLHHLP